MSERARRILEECHLIASMTEEEGRITRRFLTPPMHRVHERLETRMKDLGMQVRVDAAGNQRGVWKLREPQRSRLVLGSHLDSVPNAGAYDGVLGVVIALEWVRIAQEIGFNRPIEVIGFSEEEGVRFGVPFLGSRAAAGCFDTELLRLSDATGTTLEESIRDFGLDPSQIPQAAIDDPVRGFVEVHIEQGPVLDAAGMSVAAVTAIVGQTRGTLTFKGHANHAGTTPMHLRKDALAAGAEWISCVEEITNRTPGLVATVGKVLAEPNAANVIAAKVEVSLDCRHADDAVRAETVLELRAKALAIVERRDMRMEWTEHMNQSAVPMDAELTTMMVESIREVGLPAMRITSGAGHDAMIMASRMPTTMLFLRSPGGVSHDPAEAVLAEDIEASLQVAQRFLERLSADVG
jgi:allantoate deiminase